MGWLERLGAEGEPRAREVSSGEQLSRFSRLAADEVAGDKTGLTDERARALRPGRFMSSQVGESQARVTSSGIDRERVCPTGEVATTF